MTDVAPVSPSVAVEDILKTLGVARVVFVDDANGKGVPVEDVVVAAQDLDASLLLEKLPELGGSAPSDKDVLASKVREIWRGLDRVVQMERGQAIVAAARMSDGDGTDDVADASILGELISQDRLINLSPDEWEARKEELIRESNTQRTLFLFDQDFSDVGGDSAAGIKIVASLLATEGAESLICGLLTHTVTPETQHQQWVDLSAGNGIPRDRFVVIPKLHLSKAPLLFAQTLKFAALAPDFTALKRKTKDIIAAAVERAAERVDEVSIYDLDHIVFRVSATEGLWEPDMLFRLHAMFHRMEARRRAHEGGELEAISAKLRAVSELPAMSESPTPESAWRLQREELYELSDHINKNNLPLELGDIFERVDGISKKKYILLAQPCDLMVRGGGRRQPELNRLPLVEVIPEGEKGPPKYSDEMPYFETSPTGRWFVNFKSVHFVRGCVLDLCVFNQDGIARLAIDGDAPSGIRPTWRDRHKILSEYWSKAVRRSDVLTSAAADPAAVKQAKQQIAKSLGGLLFTDDLFKGNLTLTPDGVRWISYDCKRIARLATAQALGLLMSYTGTLGRPAMDRDFGKA